jgi:hypothetical protein
MSSVPPPSKSGRFNAIILAGNKVVNELIELIRCSAAHFKSQFEMSLSIRPHSPARKNKR